VTKKKQNLHTKTHMAEAKEEKTEKNEENSSHN
jgi:hypothetical protein